MAKRIGVVGITKAENAQLGLLLKYIFTNDEVYNSLPKEVLQFADAFTALCARYSAWVWLRQSFLKIRDRRKQWMKSRLYFKSIASSVHWVLWIHQEVWMTNVIHNFDSLLEGYTSFHEGFISLCCLFITKWLPPQQRSHALRGAKQQHLWRLSRHLRRLWQNPLTHLPRL